MRKALVLLIPISIFIIGCKQKKANTYEAISFYDSVNDQTSTAKPSMQGLIDNMSTVMKILHDRKTALIDTPLLWQFLVRAKKANSVAIENVEQIREVDQDIGYKQKILRVQLLFRRLIKNEFPQSIKIFGEHGDDRYSRASGLLLPKLTELKRALNKVAEAQAEFEGKYNFTRPSE